MIIKNMIEWLIKCVLMSFFISLLVGISGQSQFKIEISKKGSNTLTWNTLFKYMVIRKLKTMIFYVTILDLKLVYKIIGTYVYRYTIYLNIETLLLQYFL